MLSLFAFRCLSALEQASTPRSNETNLLSCWSTSRDRGGMPDVLVITTAVWVLDRIHRRTTDLWPRVPLHTVFVMLSSSLEHWLVHASSTRNDTNNRTAR